jgi:hypothetical protein
VLVSVRVAVCVGVLEGVRVSVTVGVVVGVRVGGGSMHSCPLRPDAPGIGIPPVLASTTRETARVPPLLGTLTTQVYRTDLSGMESD